MNRVLVLTFCIFCATTPPVIADPVADATYIVEQNIISGKYEEKFALLSQNFLATMKQGLERLGAEIIDPDRFLGELMTDSYREFLPKIREHAIIGYQEILTPDELASVARFYRSDEGQAFLAQEHSEETLDASIAILRAGPGEPLITHMPALWANMAEPILEWRARIKDDFSPSRIADIMELENIVKFKDESHRKLVVTLLRDAD